MGRPSRYSPEVRERAVRMVLDIEEDYDSQWAAIRVVAGQVGCSTEGLRRWVRQFETDQGGREGLSSSERERLTELEREVRELRRANTILRQASAYAGDGVKRSGRRAA
jgi:transposase